MGMLRGLGLGSDAEALYRSMIRNPRGSTAELARRLAWTEARVREARGQLVTLALVRHSWEEPGEYRVVSPEVGLETLLTRQEAEVREYQRRIAASRAAVASLLDEYGELRCGGDGLDAERLVGIDAIRSRIEELAHRCESEVLGFADGGPQTADNMSASWPLDRAILARGLRMRTVYLDSIAGSPPSAAYARRLIGAGAEVRTVAALPLRMALYDRSTALVPVDPEDSGAGAILLRGTGLLTALYALFEQVWEGASLFGGEPCRDADGLLAQEREVLRLLAQGHTDEAVARRLGVSVRTGRRITAGVMRRLDARSRFEAGVKAVERGWLKAL
ncbi:helix-turn-helix domain-containing protein [Actinomadura oligospora]|uniref:helix-turn-helix domain-containing protein n=1 Tax=Actinomadura oligospora TaxID=111804 RepID=UPI0004B8792A|nr:helix-turn-helix transcriptional regulator [Actinomadura oligospora]